MRILVCGGRVPTDIIIADHNGEFRVYLDPGGDHIAIMVKTDKAGNETDVTLAYGTPAYDRAVTRAMRGSAFL